MTGSDTHELHRPVLLNEALDALSIKPDGHYVDCTFGRGGHSRAVLARLSDRGRVIAFDRDAAAVEGGRELAASDRRFEIRHAAFSALENVLAHEGESWVKNVHGILLDLGVSSPQLDDPERGFSFTRDGPLDMRMDRSTITTAARWLANVSERELIEVLRSYGEEKFARRIAKAIIKKRADEQIVTTRQLAEIVKEAHPAWEPGQHPATRVFQAIRIFINRELDELQTVLPQAVRALAAGGRLVVISFHSLEDRIVKRFLRAEARGDQLPLGLPVPTQGLSATFKVVGKPIRPTAEEVSQNPRSRSAVLRVGERLS